MLVGEEIRTETLEGGGGELQPGRGQEAGVAGGAVDQGSGV